MPDQGSQGVRAIQQHADTGESCVEFFFETVQIDPTQFVIRICLGIYWKAARPQEKNVLVWSKLPLACQQNLEEIQSAKDLFSRLACREMIQNCWNVLPSSADRS